MQTHENGIYLNYTYGQGAGPHAVSSTVQVRYIFLPYNVTASCSGIVPAKNKDWNITSNTSCSNGIVRLSENRTSYIPPSKSLTLGAGVVLDAAGYLPNRLGSMVTPKCHL